MDIVELQKEQIMYRTKNNEFPPPIQNVLGDHDEKFLAIINLFSSIISKQSVVVFKNN